MIYSLLALGLGAYLFVAGVAAIADGVHEVNMVQDPDTLVDVGGPILPGAIASIVGVLLLIWGTVTLMMAW